jgi:hypothetical protein
MSLVIPNSPSSTPPPIVTIVEGSGDLPNPGDHSLEDTNAFNKRTNVPVTEEAGIDDEALRELPPYISITAEDRVKAPQGNPNWKARQFKEIARTDDRHLSVIVPTENQDV